MDFGYVIKHNDDWFIVNVDLNNINSGYGVVPKEEDICNLYDIDDVRQYCLEHPNMVISEHPLESKQFLLREIELLKHYLNDTDYTIIKCLELGLDANEEYSSVVEKRAQARARINELMEILNV